MSFNAAALKLMADKGLSAHDIAEIAAAAERRSDPTATERKRRQRAKEKNERDMSQRDVTRDGVSNDKDILTFPESENSEPKGSSQKFFLPADIPAEPWAAWLEARKKIRKSPTDHAKSLAVAELRRLRDEEGWPPGDVLNHCTMNSYQGIFPPRKKTNERPDEEPTAAALRRIIGPDFGAHAGTG
jgi:hypothetical protein